MPRPSSQEKKTEQDVSMRLDMPCPCMPWLAVRADEAPCSQNETPRLPREEVVILQRGANRRGMTADILIV